MGFIDKMKAANMNLGSVESPDFPCCKIIAKNGGLVIVDGTIGGKVKDYPIIQDNILIFKLVGCGGHWAKYLIVFKDGKSRYITQDVRTSSDLKEEHKGGTTIHMAPLERFIKYVDIMPDYVFQKTPLKTNENIETKNNSEDLKQTEKITHNEDNKIERTDHKIVEKKSISSTEDVKTEEVSSSSENNDEETNEFESSSFEPIMTQLKNNSSIENMSSNVNSSKPRMIKIDYETEKKEEQENEKKFWRCSCGTKNVLSLNACMNCFKKRPKD